jgi:flavin reductase (DIM6/NTAB) family NADH-FMN oxidoreductase RutF
MCKQLQPSETIQQLRRCLGQFPTGVAVVTAFTNDHDHYPVGITINSFGSLSLNPALVSWCIDCRSASYRAFCEAKTFTVTILSEQQTKTAALFATRGADKFASIDLEGQYPPVIPGGAAWFHCQVESSLPMGDHRMIIGKVTQFDKTDAAPLVFYNSSFLKLSSQEINEPQAA